jgi:glycerol-3-phosphate acyltransferase PlsX
MGGDFAPAEVVRGAVQYALRAAQGDAPPAHLLLVGDPERVGPELAAAAAKEGADPTAGITVVPAPDVIDMHEHPLQAVQGKPNSSLVVANALVKQGKADAAFSAGNTGAMMVAAIGLMGKVAGVKRPAIATLLPTGAGRRAVLVDAGANVDCRASHLLQFAVLGSVYAQSVLGYDRPRVGLLSNGEEESKGDELSREALVLLKSAAGPSLNFVGYVEGNHVYEGAADVIVCDGFVGNVLLKGSEGIAHLVLSALAADAKAASDEVAREAILNSLLKLRRQMDYAENGGAPLLGVNGVAMIAHGRSDARAIFTGIKLSVATAASGFLGALTTALGEVRAASDAAEGQAS